MKKKLRKNRRPCRKIEASQSKYRGNEKRVNTSQRWFRLWHHDDHAE